MNTTFGGLDGYSSLNSINNLKIPPSHIVYSGPNITASQSIILSSSGDALNPYGLDSYSLVQSLINLLLADVDI